MDLIKERKKERKKESACHSLETTINNHASMCSLSTNGGSHSFVDYAKREVNQGFGSLHDAYDAFPTGPYGDKWCRNNEKADNLYAPTVWHTAKNGGES